MNEYQEAYSHIDLDCDWKFAVRETLMAQALAKLKALELAYSLESELDDEVLESCLSLTREEIYCYFAFRRTLTLK